MKAADLEALALRVEREEPSRELDAAILAAVRPDEHARLEANAAAGVERAHGNKIFERDETIRRLAFSDCPRYTSSLDAAASLCPAGWKLCDVWMIERVIVRLVNSARAYAVGMAPDEPRARTAAALRARAQEMADHD